jgi:hypothetical protein
VFATLVFLTPWAALVGAAALLPVAVVAAAALRGRRAAALLRLGPAPWRTSLPVASLTAAAFVLLGLAASQPVLRTHETRTARTASQVFFVVDVSRSMLAASRPNAPTRLERARAVVERLRASIPAVPAGLAGLTDRTLPYLLPTIDARVFAETLRGSVGIETPPPRDVAAVATTFDALTPLPGAAFFASGIAHRTCVLVTDGETRPFSATSTGSALRGAKGCALVVVQVWQPGERVFRADGQPEAQYRPDRAATSAVAALAAAAGGRAFAESDGSSAASALRQSAERGPRGTVGSGSASRALAPFVVAGGGLLLVLLAVSRLATRELRKKTSLSYDDVSAA